MESIESDTQETQQGIEKDVSEYESRYKQVEKSLPELVDLVEEVDDEPGSECLADKDSSSCLIGYCRICACAYESMISIYDETGMEMQLEEKINNYLPITVKRSDKLPLQLCPVCVEKLNVTHDLIISCLDSDSKFKYMEAHNNSEHQED